MKPDDLSLSVILPVYAPTPFLRSLTEFCIKTLRSHAIADFELVVVEAGGDYFDPARKTGKRLTWNLETIVDAGSEYDTRMRVDKYLHFPERDGVAKQLNAGFAAASNALVVHTGNDVIVPPQWDAALVEPFARYKDCGISCLSAYEPGAIIGPMVTLPMIVEGVYTPFMAFSRRWRLDERYYGSYSDSDLVMRVYGEGLRSYRTCRAFVHHMKSMTWKEEGDLNKWQVASGEKLFYDTWGSSPLMIFGIIRYGAVVHGREQESILKPIQRHELPIKTLTRPRQNQASDGLPDLAREVT